MSVRRMVWVFVLAVGLPLAACDGGDDPPAGDPLVAFAGEPSELPNAEFGYRYEARYSWPGDNSKQRWHAVAVHECKMQYQLAGVDHPIRARMSYAEFLPFDDDGELATRVDHIGRANLAGQRITQAVECCRHTLFGAEKRGPVPDGLVLVPLRDEQGSARVEAATGAFVYRESTTELALPGGAKPAESSGYYLDAFAGDPRPERPLDLRLDRERATGWTTNYGFTEEPPGADKEVLQFGGGLRRPSVGDERIAHECDF
jgi:hypothetical protein